MTIDGLGELGLLERIKPYLSSGAGGDDAAVIADATGFVVASTDTFVEGVHYDFDWMTAEDVGWRALALALGDLAAKGAQPVASGVGDEHHVAITRSGGGEAGRSIELAYAHRRRVRRAGDGEKRQ